MTGATGPVGVGIVGAGVISDEYLRNLTSFPDIAVRYVSDVDLPRAEVVAQTYGVMGAGTLEEMLRRRDVELVVNLTNPAAHADVTSIALAHGKHVWVEKPLATTREAGRTVLSEARRRGLLVAGAPDTFLGPGHQSALHSLSSGLIGDLVSATACSQGPGPEGWHPNPDFLYAAGAGPLFDMGPYYITMLVQAFGPISAVVARSSTSRPRRIIASGPRAGETFEVHVPTHVCGTLDFRNGGFAQLTLSFDSPIRRTGLLEIHGRDGVVVMPDPNTFDDDHHVWRFDAETGTPRAALSPVGFGRGLGVLDLARSIRTGVPEKASGDLAFHVLDVLVALEESSATQSSVQVGSTVHVSASRVSEPSPLDCTL